MLMHTFNLALAGILFAALLIKQVLDFAGLADSLENHAPLVFRGFMNRRVQPILLIIGFGLLFDDLHNPRLPPPSISSAPLTISTNKVQDSPMILSAREKPVRAAARPKFSQPVTWPHLAAEILSFQGEMLRTEPLLIISSFSTETTNRSMEQSRQHNQDAIVRFEARFSVPVADIIRDAQRKGLDASPLEGHMEALNSIQMMRLIAADINSLASQASPQKEEEKKKMKG